MTGKWPSIALLTLCQVLGLCLWFSATALVPAWRADGIITDGQASLYASMVSLGFVAGTLCSAVLGLADRLPPKRFFMASALVAALANAAILLTGPASGWVVVLRFVTGACMAGLYPVGMKIGASWARNDMGLLIGLLVGGITLGNGLPYLLNVVGGVDWRFTLVAASVLAACGGLLVNLVGLGPALGKSPPFEPRFVLRAWTDRPSRLANMGYFGHMWELFAMWGWIGVFLSASFSVTFPDAPLTASLYANLLTAGVFVAGCAGCLAGGLFADRFGRTTATMAALIVSGACCIAAGFAYGGPTWLLVAICLIWGFSVIADSAQFSSCVIELSDPQYVGTMLTIQTCIGFTLTLVTIHLWPYMVDMLGWRYAFAPLAIGPVLGYVAMARLRASPDAVRLAGGRR